MRLISYLPLSVFLLTTSVAAQTCEQGNHQGDRPLDHIVEQIRKSDFICRDVDVIGARVTIADKLSAAGMLIFDSSNVLKGWPDYLYKLDSTPKVKNRFRSLCDNEALLNVSLGMVVVFDAGDGGIDHKDTESFTESGVALPPAPPNTQPSQHTLDVRDLCHWVKPTLKVLAQDTNDSPLYLVTDHVIPFKDMKFIGRARVGPS